MTGDELADAARALFNNRDDAIGLLAGALGIRGSNFVKMLKDKSRIPPGVEADVKRMLALAAAAHGGKDGGNGK